MLLDVFVRDTGIKGLGVFARRSFAPGEFIFRRRHGRMVHNDEIPTLPDEDQRHLCELDRYHSAVLLPPGCYLNHSCEPNAMRSGVRVFAWRPIAAGDEITIDYRLNAFDDSTWTCLCGAPSCPDTVRSNFFSLDPEQQRAYFPYAPAFIRREYRSRQR